MSALLGYFFTLFIQINYFVCTVRDLWDTFVIEGCILLEFVLHCQQLVNLRCYVLTVIFLDIVRLTQVMCNSL